MMGSMYGYGKPDSFTSFVASAILFGFIAMFYFIFIVL